METWASSPAATSDVDDLWRVSVVDGASRVDICGDFVPESGAWALAVFGAPITPDRLKQILPDPLED